MAGRAEHQHLVNLPAPLGTGLPRRRRRYRVGQCGPAMGVTPQPQKVGSGWLKQHPYRLLHVQPEQTSNGSSSTGSESSERTSSQTVIILTNSRGKTYWSRVYLSTSTPKTMNLASNPLPKTVTCSTLSQTPTCTAEKFSGKNSFKVVKFVWDANAKRIMAYHFGCQKYVSSTCYKFGK